MSFVNNLVKLKVRPEILLENMNPAEMFSDENFNAIKYAAFYFLESLEMDGALAFSSRLEKLLLAASPRDQREKEMLNVLMYWCLGLKLFCLRLLPTKDQAELFKKYPVKMLESGLDVRAAVYKFIDIFSTGEIIEGYTKSFAGSLLNSEAVLGTSAAFSKSNFKPTVHNWLNEYQQSINKRGLNIKSGAFDLVNFMEINQYARLLDASEKEVLKSLISLYNWLLSPIVYEEPTQQKSYITQQNYKLPDSVAKGTPAIKLPPVVPVPKDKREQKPMGDVAGRNVGMSEGRKLEQAGIKNYELGIRENGNQKPAEAGLVDSNAVFEPGLSSTNRISQTNNLVKRQSLSGGGEGNRTPRAMDDSPGSAPRHPQPQTLYHNAPGRPVNIQDILKSKDEELRGKRIGNSQESIEENQPAGIRMSDGQGQMPSPISQPMAQIPNPQQQGQKQLPPIQPPKQVTDINRKLEELKKKMKQ